MVAVADIEAYLEAVKGVYAGLLADGSNTAATHRGMNQVALAFLGAENLVDLVAECLQAHGLPCDTANLSTDSMREVCDRLAVKLTHPDPETALRGPA